MCTKNQNHMMYGSWDMEPDRQDFLSFWAIFCTFTPLTTQKVKILKKWKKPFYIILQKKIILHQCTKNHDHMLYCSWDMASDRCNCYFSFWTIFCPFTPFIAQKIKIKKKWKKGWRYHHFTQVYQKSWYICYTVPEIWRVMDVIVILGYFLPFYPPNNPKN